MKIKLVAIGGKMPAWVEAGTKEYQKRLPRNFELLVNLIPILKNYVRKKAKRC
jgi:23S rRNA (pseudouridine1915-N3)-methyltransferase